MKIVEDNYKLNFPENWDISTFRAAIKEHIGPLYFLHLWDRLWEKN